jgi:hypothetical protein
MRSSLVYSAERTVENRFLLATLTFRAVRALHIDATRPQDTTNRVLEKISDGQYGAKPLPLPEVTDDSL